MSQRYRYEGARDRLLELLSRESLNNGTRLPPERELTEVLGVSRPTLRHALSLLAQEGLIRRRRGSGTYLVERRVTIDVRMLVSLTQSIAESGMSPGAKVILAESLPADRKLADRLSVPPESPIEHVERIRFADGRTVAFERSWFPGTIVPNLRRFDLEHRSIYDVLRQEYGVRLLRAEQQFRAGVADAHVGRLLGCEPGTSIMVVRRLSFDHHSRAIEYAVDSFLPSRTVFRSTALVT